jgi:hypothetical protein
MTNALHDISDPRRRGIWISCLIAASVLLSLAFACATPLAAFAAIAASSLKRRDALFLITGVWLANQAVGFALLHCPTDAATFAWGGALGVITLLSCEIAGVIARQSRGAKGVIASFVAAFIIYEGAIFTIALAIGQDAEHFTFLIVSRIFLINACAFGGLWALKALTAADFDHKRMLEPVWRERGRAAPAR